MPQSNGKPPHGPHGATSTDAAVSFYENVLDSKSQQTYPLKTVLDKIRSCFWGERVDALRSETEPIKQDRLKKELPGATFAGTFDRRNKDSCTAFTGIVTLDFDAKDNTGERAALLSDIFPKAAEHESTLAAFISPRGEGAKILVRTDATIDTYPAAYQFVKAEYESLTGCVADKSGADIARLCFVSADPDAYINYEATALHVPPANVAPKPRNVGNRPAFADSQPLTDRAEQWATEGGPFAEGNRHNWVFRFAGACNRLGVPSSDCRGWLHGSGRWFDDVDCERSLRDTYVKEAHRHGEHAPRTQRPAVNIAVRRVNTQAARVVHVEQYASEKLDELQRELVRGVCLLWQAPTGSGKTKAVFSLARLLVDAGTFDRVVYLVPYRRLAEHNAKDYSDNDVALVCGGVSGKELDAARQAKIIVATYDGLGKLWEAGKVPPRTLLVVDECHELTDAMGYRPKALKLVSAAADAAIGSDGAVLYVTATPGEHFADAFGLSVLRIVPEHVNRKQVTVHLAGAWKRRKRACFAALAAQALANPEKVFVLFCNSKRALNQALAYLKKTGLPSDAVVRVTSNDDDAARPLLTKENKFQPGVRVVLATKAFGAGYNVKNTDIGGVFLLPNGNEGLRPADAAQYTARFREMGADGTPPLLVHVFAGQPKTNGRNANRGMAELLAIEKFKGDKAKNARQEFDLAKVDDRLPSVRLDSNALSLERTTDPDKGVVLQTNVHHAYFLASEQRNRARTLEDYVACWGQYDPGATFDVRDVDDVDGATGALLQTIEDEHRLAEIEARESVSAWTVSHVMAVAYRCIPRLRTDVRRYDPNARESANDVSDADRERFLLAGGTTAAQRFLGEKLTSPDGTVPVLRPFPAPKLWTRCVLDGNPNKFAKWKTSMAVALQLERQAGRLGDALLFDGLKASDFLLWERYGLLELTTLVKTQGDGRNMKAVYEAVRDVLKRHGFDLSDYLFRQVLVPLYFHIGPTVRLTNDDGTRPRVRRLERLTAAQTADGFASAFGLERGEYERFVERLKEDRQAVAKAAKAKENAENEAKAIAAAESVATENERLPVPMLAARLGADNAVAAVTFANDPPDDEPCPF